MAMTRITHRYQSYLRIAGEAYTAWPSGPSCSKLTTSLVNVSLIFQTLILQIHCYFFFFVEKCENPLHCKEFLHFFNKNNSVFAFEVVIYLTN